jgi:hypothetical protein
MKKMRILIALLLMPCANAVYADPMVLRASANRYALVGEGTVVTKDCTVTAEGGLTARIERDRSRNKSWIKFIDRDGEEEAECEVLTKVSRPHRLGRPMLAAK